MENSNQKFYEVTPLADIIDEEKCATLTLEVPGANSRTVWVEVKNQILKISAKSTLEKGGNPILFKRAFELSDAVAVDQITAKTEDGVLTVVLPKSERAQVHRITVE